MRCRRLAALPAAAAVLLLLAVAAPAHAAGYRYWSYWLNSGGSWTYAQTGPAMHTPADGSVEGWRFAISKDAAAKAVQPRGSADFAHICAAVPPVRGSKRVALLIDPGTPADAPTTAAPPAPRTACARIPQNASSADALAAVARPLRYNSAGIVCAITGYPAAGCGEQVSSSTASAPKSSHDGPSLGLIAGAAAVAALAAAAIWQSRRRR
ncbi:SCO2322 family protein [Streptomyces sp. NPDC049040]|uniref:SCO2322 family protein n=1 Tax=Streptomyces sp. NPDC049040 TaxID=3365593 RepID=UPI00371E523C